MEACAVKLAATMEGERTRRAVPTHREPAAAESTAAEAAAHGVGADSTVSAAAVSTTVSTTTVSTTTVSAATVSAPATRRRNGWSKGHRRADCGGGGNGHEALSEHDSASLVPSPPSRS